MVSGRAWAYISAVVAATLVAVGGVAAHRPLTAFHVDDPWVALATLQALFLICDAVKSPLTSRQTIWSPSSSATLAAVVLLGPVYAAFVGATSLISLRRERQPRPQPRQEQDQDRQHQGGRQQGRQQQEELRLSDRLAERLFNGAMHALSGLAAGEAYLALHGPVGLPAMGQVYRIVGAFAAAAVVHVLANHSLIWGIYRLNRGSGALRRERLESSLLLLLASDLGYACFGLMIAFLWPVMTWFAAVIVLVPLFVARWAMDQFAEQQRAYSATMNALCQAVETKDFYTRGHGDRVSKGAVMIARQIGMSSDRTDAIKFAGMLHDVGKLGVPTQVLQKTGPLTEDEFAAIQLHPMRGLAIVQEIGFLYEALTGIMHHHERIDGTGYPMGLAGHEIPEFARVIAVADAFDSMTSTRSYRAAKSKEDAVTELRKGAGSQFDPLLVQAFIAALEEEGWPLPKAASWPADLATVTAQDHDDPTAPLRVVIP